jgi:hypothetical protein
MRLSVSEARRGTLASSRALVATRIKVWPVFIEVFIMLFLWSLMFLCLPTEADNRPSYDYSLPLFSRFFSSELGPLFSLAPGLSLAGCSDTCCAFLFDGWADFACFAGCLLAFCPVGS